MRPLWMEFPHDEAVFNNDEDFMVGNSILVQVVFSEETKNVSVYLPGEQSWYCMRSGNIYKGGLTHKIDMFDESVPAFQKAGTIIPRKDRFRHSATQMVNDPYTLPTSEPCVVADSRVFEMGIPLKTDTKLFNCKEAAALEQDNEDEYDDDEYLPAEENINPVQAAMMEDDKDEFVSLIKGVSKDRMLEAYSEMFSFDSVDCFAAMLAGEAGEVLNTAYFLAVENIIPLLGSARKLRAPKITTLLLKKGYEANLRTDFTSMDVCLENTLPLNVALETYRAYRWKGGSAVHLITSFCGPMWPCKENIAIPARNTKEIKLEFYEYLKQGKMVEVGILLTVASDCILSPSSAEGEDDISFKNLSEMHKFLSEEIDKLSVDATVTQLECEDQLLDMKMTLELLEIFDKIGDKLTTQTETQLTRSELVSLIQDAGFDVSSSNADSEFNSFKDISEMRKFLSDEMAKLSVDATNTQSQCENQLLEMKMTLEFHEIFDKIGDKLIAQTQTQLTSSELVSLIQDAGFDVSSNADSEFRSFHVNVVERGLHDESPSSINENLPTVLSTPEERELCYQAYMSGQWSKFPTPWSVSVLPSRITVTVDRSWFTDKQAKVTGASGNEV